MKAIYTYKFVHHSYLDRSNYQFTVYLAHCPDMYDIIYEFDGQEAFKHYQVVVNATPQYLQHYLHMISHPYSYKKMPTTKNVNK